MNEESLFAAVLEIPTAEERRAFLERECGDDVALQRRIERLVAAHEKSLGILDQEATPLGGREKPADWPRTRRFERRERSPESTEFIPGASAERGTRFEGVGTLIADRYRLIEEIGEGGMGTVYMAEQTQPVRRQVALKVIKAGLDSRAVLARFEAERQALAVMDHPNIAKVLDGGTTESGRPFFVMEYVQGVPITQYCDQARSSVDERLALFVPVCNAIQHAHSKGVIHRDLKPSNILVCIYDDKPVPKVIDFGLAKATNQALTEHAVVTAQGVLLGTPLYMSPEQAQFDTTDVDTRTDVYALGAVLFELLTGTTPLERKRLQQAAWDEALRLIREEEPPRPSARLGGCEALPSIAALRGVEPSRLTRMVRGELDWIVLKCLDKDRNRRYETADGLARDLQRFLADESVEACPPSTGYRVSKFLRRNRAAILAAAVFVLLLVGGIIGTTWGMFRAVRARQAEAARAEGERRANDQAQRRLRQIEKGSEVLASVFRDLDPISEQKEGKTLRVLLADRLARAADELDAAEVGDALITANIQNRLGISLLNLGQPARAVPLLEKAHGARRDALGADHPDTLTSLNALSSALHATGRRDRALALAEETLRARQARLGPEHPDTINSMHNLAFEAQAIGQLDRALKLYEETLRLREKHLGPDDPKTLDTRNGLAVALQNAGRFDRSVPLLEETLKLRRARQGPDHLDTLNTMNNLAVGYRASGQLEKALPLLEETLALVKAKVGPEHPDTLTSMNNLARGYLAVDRKNEALRLFEETFRLRRDRLGANHPDTFNSMNNLATMYQAMGQLDKALPLLEETLLLRRQHLAPNHPDTLVSVYNMAAGHRAAGKIERAIPLYREAAVMLEAIRYNHQGAERIIEALVEVLESSKDFSEAETWKRKWLGVVKERKGDDSPAASAARVALGENLLRQSRWFDAEVVLREASIAREKQEPKAWTTHDTRSLLGAALLGQRKFDAAESLLLSGYQEMKALESQLSPGAKKRVAEAGQRILQLYEQWEKPGKLAEWREKLKPADAPQP